VEIEKVSNVKSSGNQVIDKLIARLKKGTKDFLFRLSKLFA